MALPPMPPFRQNGPEPSAHAHTSSPGPGGGLRSLGHVSVLVGTVQAGLHCAQPSHAPQHAGQWIGQWRHAQALAQLHALQLGCAGAVCGGGGGALGL